MGFGVYVHFPYCRKRCPYCDFAVHARARIPHQRYATAVLHELAARAPLYAGRALASVYFGGGTPGLWEPEEVARVLAGVRATFPPGRAPIEVTLEANPEDLPRARLDGLRRAGVTRLSLGVQTLARRHLVTLGRLHGPGDPVVTVGEARAAGFDDLSLDLMFGLPSQRPRELERDLDGVLALAPEHLSLYGLTVEERTALAARVRAGELALPDAEAQAAMYERVRERLEAAGYAHYEVSSYARPGRRAVHNSLYWSGGEWLGLGCSSHSFRRLDVAGGGGAVAAGGERFSTVRSVDDYFARVAGARVGSLDGDPLVATREALSAEALAREAMWLGLRLVDEGVDRAGFAARFGADPVARFGVELWRLAREALVEVDERRVRLTRRGVLFADEVGARFL